MREFARSMILPFSMALLPALWYVNRNLTTAVLPPRIEPTVALIAVAVVAALAGSAVFAAVVVLLGRAANERLGDGLGDVVPSSRLRRAIHPDDATLVVFAGSFCYLFAWVVASAVGSRWLVTVLSPLGGVLLLPLYPLVLLSFELGLESIDHVLTVVGMALSAVWMLLLATVVSDMIARHRRD